MKVILLKVVYFGATWATFKPKLKELKKNTPRKNSYVLMLFATKKLNKTFFKFLARKNLFICNSCLYVMA